MKQAIIVHCWDGRPTYCWYPYVKRELEKRGFTVSVPAFPETESPQLIKWLPKLQETIGTPNEDVLLVGHSVGCITILRYLETLRAGEKIGGAILVAGFTDDLGYAELKNFFTKPIDFKKIKKCCRKFVAIHSDNDPYVDLKCGDIFKKELGAKLIIKQGMNHFSGEIDDEKSCTELPDVVAEALSITS